MVWFKFPRKQASELSPSSLWSAARSPNALARNIRCSHDSLPFFMASVDGKRYSTTFTQIRPMRLKCAEFICATVSPINNDTLNLTLFFGLLCMHSQRNAKRTMGKGGVLNRHEQSVEMIRFRTIIINNKRTEHNFTSCCFSRRFFFPPYDQ